MNLQRWIMIFAEGFGRSVSGKPVALQMEQKSSGVLPELFVFC